MDYHPQQQQYTYSNNSSMNNFHSATNYEQSIQGIVGNNNPFIPSSINTNTNTHSNMNTNIHSTNRNQITSQMNQNNFNYPSVPVSSSNNAFQIKTPANYTNMNQLTNNINYPYNNSMNHQHNHQHHGKCGNNGGISPTTTTTSSTIPQNMNDMGFVNAISLDHTSSNSSFSSSTTTTTTSSPPSTYTMPQNDNLSMYHHNHTQSVNKTNCLPQATPINNVESHQISNYAFNQHQQQQHIDCNNHTHTVYNNDCYNPQQQQVPAQNHHHGNNHNNHNTLNPVYTSNYSQQQQWLEPQQQGQQQSVQWSVDPQPRPAMHNNLSNVSSSTMTSSSSHNENNSIQIGSTNSQWMNCNGQHQPQQPSYSSNMAESTSYNLSTSDHQNVQSHSSEDHKNMIHSINEMYHTFTNTNPQTINTVNTDNNNGYKIGGISSTQFHGNNNSGDSDRNLEFQNGLNAADEYKPISTKTEPIKEQKVRKKSSSSLAKNAMIHSCHVCGKLFKHKCNLKIHSVIHTSAALSCVYCGKKFARISNLNEHVKIHTNFRPFQCQYCDKTFRQKQTLIDHTRTHTGERPFKCDFCNKAFKVKHNLKSHRRLHTGERPFICSLCPKKFASKSSLNGHIRRKHNAYWKIRNQ